MCVHVPSNCGKDDLPENVGYLPTVGWMELPENVETQLASPNWVALTKPLI